MLFSGGGRCVGPIYKKQWESYHGTRMQQQSSFCRRRNSRRCRLVFEDTVDSNCIRCTSSMSSEYVTRSRNKKPRLYIIVYTRKNIMTIYKNKKKKKKKKHQPLLLLLLLKIDSFVFVIYKCFSFCCVFSPFAAAFLSLLLSHFAFRIRRFYFTFWRVAFGSRNGAVVVFAFASRPPLSLLGFHATAADWCVPISLFFLFLFSYFRLNYCDSKRPNSSGREREREREKADRIS